VTVLQEDEDTAEGGRTLDVSLVAKALVLTGVVILVVYLILRYLAVTTYADGSWRVFTLTQPGVLEGVVVISCVFLIFGAIAYFIHLQFVKLADIAEVVMAVEEGEESSPDLPQGHVEEETDEGQTGKVDNT
jgi:hypothetical protein